MHTHTRTHAHMHTHTHTHAHMHTHTHTHAHTHTPGVHSMVLEEAGRPLGHAPRSPSHRSTAFVFSHTHTTTFRFRGWNYAFYEQYRKSPIHQTNKQRKEQKRRRKKRKQRKRKRSLTPFFKQTVQHNDQSLVNHFALALFPSASLLPGASVPESRTEMRGDASTRCGRREMAPT